MSGDANQDARAPLALEARDVVAGYEPGLPIVRGARLAVGAGEVVALLGPNRAGKSTFVQAIAGLVPVTTGSVRLFGREVTTLAAHRMVREGRFAGTFPRVSSLSCRVLSDQARNRLHQ